jgi:hypothetical protein
VATSPKPYHPPKISEYQPPRGEHAGYIEGPTGCQGFGSRTAFVALIPCAQARAVIIKHHYSHRVVNNSYLHLGVYLEGRLCGVLQFGYALCPARAGKVVAGTVQGQYLELNRMWLDDAAPRNSESRAISQAIKYIRRAMPTVAWVQSFADERCGRWGVVYQAANFLYCGHHVTAFYELDGQTYHKMLLTAHKKGGQRGEHLRKNLDRAVRRSLRQFRYVYFIKRDWMRRLKLPVLPYPKPEEERE